MQPDSTFVWWLFDPTWVTNRPSTAWCATKHNLLVSMSQLPCSLSNLRLHCTLPSSNDHVRPFSYALPLHISGYFGWWNGLICKCVWIFARCRKRALPPGQHLLIGSPSRIDKEGFIHKIQTHSGESARAAVLYWHGPATLVPILVHSVKSFAFVCVCVCGSHEYKPRVTGFIWTSHKWNIGCWNKLYLVCINHPHPLPHPLSPW